MSRKGNIVAETIENLQQVRSQYRKKVKLSTQQIDCIITVSNSWTVSVSFPYQSTNYDFIIVANNASFIKFLRLYIQETNDQRYGTIDPVTDGVVTDSNMRDQFASLIVVHFFSCLDKIFVTKARYIRDYAVWFRKKIDSSSSYSLHVQKSVCNFIVHEDFMSGIETYDITNWSVV